MQCISISCTLLVPNTPLQKDIMHTFRMAPLNCCWWQMTQPVKNPQSDSASDCSHFSCCVPQVAMATRYWLLMLMVMTIMIAVVSA